VSFEYRLVVISAGTGSSKGTLTQSNAIFSVDSYDVAPDGNCLEATFQAPPKALPFTIALRDVVTIETRPDSTSSWVPRYRGYVTLAGNPLSDNVETYRLVGLKQRFYERIPTFSSTAGDAGAVIVSDDVATMAAVAFDASNANGTIAGVSSTAVDAPLLTFIQGDRFTQLESIGECLDALTATVGRFIVPASSTYTYDSVTFNDGDLVPPVTWGVRADGSRFFRRTLSSVLAVNESDLGTDVVFPALSGEDVVTRPILLYYPGMDRSYFIEEDQTITTNVRETTSGVYQPWVYKSTAGAADAVDRVFQLPDPAAFLVDATSLFSETNVSWVNPDRMFDGNPSTFATGAGASIALLILERLNVPLDLVNHGVSLDVEVEDNTSFLLWGINGYSALGQNLRYNWIAEFKGPDTAGQTTRYRFTFPSLIPAEVYQRINDATNTLDDVTFYLAVTGSNDALVYDARVFTSILPTDDTVASRLSQAYARPVIDAVTNVKVYGERELFTRVDVTPLVGSVIEAPVERVQYSITTAEGVTTTYHAGQAFDGELVSERVVLEGLARRAVRS